MIEIDFCLEVMYELLIEGEAPEDFCLKMINYYDGLKEKGETNITVTLRV